MLPDEIVILSELKIQGNFFNLPVFPSVAKCCQLLPSVAKCCQVLPRVAKCCQVFPSVAKCCQMLPSVAKCCQVLPSFHPSLSFKMPVALLPDKIIHNSNNLRGGNFLATIGNTLHQLATLGAWKHRELETYP